MPNVTNYSDIPTPTRLKGDRYWVDVKITEEGDRIFMKYGFSKKLKDDIKAMDGSRWHPETKSWSVLNTRRNWFQLAFLAGHNVYGWYDRPVMEHTFEPRLHRNSMGFIEKLTPYKHQQGMILHGLTYHFGIWASQQGTGKSLAAIYTMEMSGLTSDECWYVGPKSAQASFDLELEDWFATVHPRSLTYEGLVKLLSDWPAGMPAPKFVFFDESSRLKNPTSKRSMAAYHLAESMRNEWGDKCYVILGSGTPAPKSPADFWWQCEIACPGFIKEGTIAKFKARLGLIVMKEAFATGGQFPHLVTWKDDENKCNICGQFEKHDYHEKPTESAAEFDDLVKSDQINNGEIFAYHPFEKSTNEVALLYKRMKGLTIVNFKKDCLSELPEKRFRVIKCKPTQSIVNAARLIMAQAKTVVSSMTLLRELSDGFQYVRTENGLVTCTTCSGERKVIRPVPIVDEDIIAEEMDKLLKKAALQYGGDIPTLLMHDDPRYDAQGMPIPEYLLFKDKYEMQPVKCPECHGEGQVMTYTVQTAQVPCPKEDVTKDTLDAHDDDGRLVIYAGFQGSIDRCVQISQKMNWEYIRVDGRGWHSSITGLRSPLDMIKAFQRRQIDFPRLAFIGHPASAGMGLTLTASCEELFYSNDFNAESRLQALDRIHRPGMDVNKGAQITDIVHLPSDQKVLDNLDKKIRLQDMAMGDFKTAMDAALNTATRDI